jgi:GT2 family glycosyltransferase
VSERRASVVVVTYERPTYLARCLDHLAAQSTAPFETIVVDSSTGRETAELVAEHHTTVHYVVCAAGGGATATARDLGYRRAAGEIVAFIDDDAFAEQTWLERLLAHFDDPTVGGVGGRQIRGQPGELTEGVEEIGRLLPDGRLTGNFTADPGRAIEVDHLLGASMSFRRSVIAGFGGIHDGYRGTCVREESDLCLRVGRAGFRLVYEPTSVVEHVAAPYVKGQRFDLRYAYWAQKNQLILLMRIFGVAHPLVRRYLATSILQVGDDGRVRAQRAKDRARSHDVRGAAASAGGGATRAAVVAVASLTGLLAGASAARADRHAV